MTRMKWFFVVPLIPVFIAIVILIGGELVMHLWNWILPPLFGFRQINFWQAFGLLALCRILFGNFGGRGHRRGRPWRRRPGGWVRITPEELESFRDRIRSRCAGFEPPAAGSKEPA